jgi:3-deoxy-D-manno-octulosonic-acid transferase
MTLFDTIYLSLYPFLPFAVKKLGPGLPDRLGKVRLTRSKKRLVVFHAASVGETNTVKPLLETLGKTWDDVDFAISTITEQGRLNANKILRNNVVSAPLDLSPFVKRFYRWANPSLLVLVEQELWPNLILNAKCPIALVAGRMSMRSFGRYNKLRYLFKKVFDRLDLVVTQTEEYRERFISLGTPRGRVKVSGSLKFDSIPQIDEKTVRDQIRSKYLLRDSFTLLAASTHEPEEKLVLEAFRQLRINGASLIIAPRHISRADDIRALVESLGLKCYKSSEPVIKDAVLIIDKMGELYNLYAACDMAFVGGSLVNRGGHNILEPASLGKSIITGPSLHNFAFAAKPLQELGALRTVHNATELERVISELSALDLDSIGRKAREYVDRNKGACKITCQHLTELLR